MTQQEVKRLFEYKEDGNLYNKIPRANNKLKIGEIAGHVNPGLRSGYLMISINRKNWAIHCLIFLYHYGFIPESEIDHKDGNKLNNRIGNLRIASPFQNKQNRGMLSNNQCGYKGVLWHKGNKYWQAKIQANKKIIYLGGFKTPELAYEAYKQAALIHHKEFAHV